jgi:hypothetical protein
VAGISLAVGMLAIARVLAPALDAWTDAHGLLISAAVIGATFACFTLALFAAQRRAPVPA